MVKYKKTLLALLAVLAVGTAFMAGRESVRDTENITAGTGAEPDGGQQEPDTYAEAAGKTYDRKLPLEYTYIVLKDGSIKLTSYWGKDNIVFVPDKIRERTVSTIGEKCFYNNNAIEQVVLSPEINEIEDSAFAYCSMLQNVIMGKGVRNIGVDAFSYCASLKELRFVEGMTKLPAVCRYCPCLEKVYMPQGVEWIHVELFANCPSLRLVYGNCPDVKYFAQERGMVYVDLDRIQEEGNLVW